MWKHSSSLSSSQASSCLSACRCNLSQQPRRWLATDASGNGGKRSKWRLVVYGVGAVGSLTVAGTALRSKRHNDRIRKLEGTWDVEAPKRKKLVVLGSGWGAMSLLRQLEPGLYDVHVISPRNYFLFTPLLPSVTVGTVEARSIASPIRKLLQRSHGNLAHYYEAECVSIDIKNRIVKCKDTSEVKGSVSSFDLPFDQLVIAVGSQSTTFNTPGVEKYAHFMKEIPDALKIRKKIMDNIETAFLPGQSEKEQRRLMHSVVVGGGPTGVEFAAELRDFLVEDLSKIYPGIADKLAISVIQSQGHILNTYDSAISQYTESVFEKHNTKIDVIAKARVVAVSEEAMTVHDKETKIDYQIPYGLCIWAAGNNPRPLVQSVINGIPEQTNTHGLVTDNYMRVKGARCVYALGDCHTSDTAILTNQAEKLFREADVNGDGYVSCEEFEVMMENAQKKYPHVNVFFATAKEAHGCNIFSEADANNDHRLDFAEFKQLLKKVDSQLRSLPATAAVANQQGVYLGSLLNELSGSNVALDVNPAMTGCLPFHYRYMGSFAYVGDNKAVLQVPVFGALKGWWTMLIWRAFYFSSLSSWRTRFMVGADWTKAKLFGRDTSRL